METSPFATTTTRNELTTSPSHDVVLVPPHHQSPPPSSSPQQQQQRDIDCDNSPMMTTHKTNIDNNNELRDAPETIESPPHPPLVLSSKSATSHHGILPSTSLGADESNVSITSNNNNNDNGNNHHDNNHTSQPESKIKLKRCKHGRIIIKDLSKKKLPTATTNESNRNQIKNISSNLPPESNERILDELIISKLPPDDFTTKQSTVAITKSPPRSLKDEKSHSPSPPPVVRPSRSESTSELSTRETKDGLSPANVTKSRPAAKSPRRRRRSRSRSGSRSYQDRRKSKAKSPIIGSRHTPSPPPTSSRRRSSRSTSRSRGRSPYRRHDSPSPRRRDRSSPRRKRDRRRRRDDRRRSPRRSRNRASYRRESPRPRSKSPRARRGSGSLSPDERGASNSYGRFRQDYRSPSRDNPRERYESDSRFDSSRRKDLFDEVHSRSLLEECKTSADALDTSNIVDNYATKSQLLHETQKAASLEQTSKPPPHQNHKKSSSSSSQSNVISSQPPSDPIRSSPLQPAAVSPPPPKNEHSKSSSRGSPSAPSPATPSNNSISSDIYDPEGPIIPISPGDSPPLSDLSDLDDYAKPPIVHRPNNQEKNGEDDVPSSAVQLNHQEKYLQKLNRQERVIEEVKIALRPHYQRRDINKEQYKDVLRRAVPKICHSKKGEINPIKIRALVAAYVGKMKRHRS